MKHKYLCYYFGLKFLPYVLPNLKDAFNWVPFIWGIFIIAITGDLTQYWYHCLHHQIPFLWRFHRTHHSASYMGMAMASHQNVIYTILFSLIYLTTTLVYLGLGYPALFVTVLKGIITTLAHSSIKWDKPFYDHKFLHPVAWVLERTISTPATHHAHHADTHDDGVGYYKGNFGNMFFIWDIIFNTSLMVCTIFMVHIQIKKRRKRIIVKGSRSNRRHNCNIHLRSGKIITENSLIYFSFLNKPHISYI